MIISENPGIWRNRFTWGLAIGFAATLMPAGAQPREGWASSAFPPISTRQTSANTNDVSSRQFLNPQLPFSFIYGGKASRDVLPGWHLEVEEADEAPLSTRCVSHWTDPTTRLRLTAEVTSYKDFDATEWLLRFENTGAIDTPILEKVQSLDLSFNTSSPEYPLELHQIRGSSASPGDFTPSVTMVRSGESVQFAPNSGRSSDSAFPFFTLSDGKENLITAIGWTGRWSATFDRDLAGGARLRAGMELTHLKLHPGESIRTPRILLLSHFGNRIETQNIFRRLILAHYTPRINGQPPQAAIGAQSFNHMYLHSIPDTWATEAGQIRAAEINRAAGADTLWMDAGWFPGNFPKGAGNWFPKPYDFPRGLKPVGDACRRLGLRFLLWYEPERAAVGTVIANEHPEFVLGGKEGGLFNLGDPKARRWMTDLIDRQIDEFGLDCYRQDLNFDPLPFWRANDVQDRQGITEIRHIEGLYAMWDELRRRHPSLYIDNCSGGGTRIDLETISRSIVQTRSDSEGTPGLADWEQSQTWGLSLYYPLSSSFTWDLTTYDFRSYASRGLLGEWDVLSPQFPIDTVRRGFAEARANQSYFTGDYFPLTPWTVAADQWMAYQFHRVDLNAGIVLAFRHAQSGAKKLRIHLKDLIPDARYQVTFIGDDYVPDVKAMESSALADFDLELDNPRSSLLIRYQLLKLK